MEVWYQEWVFPGIRLKKPGSNPQSGVHGSAYDCPANSGYDQPDLQAIQPYGVSRKSDPRVGNKILTMADTKKMEDLLMKHLSHPGINKNTLKKYSAALAHSSSGGFNLERIWWIGIPVPEWVFVQGRLGIDKLAILENLLKAEITSVEIFPLGIPAPIELQATIKIPLMNVESL